MVERESQSTCILINCLVFVTQGLLCVGVSAFLHVVIVKLVLLRGSKLIFKRLLSRDASKPDIAYVFHVDLYQYYAQIILKY